MTLTIKELQEQGLSKNLIYEALKTVWVFSKQYIKNKRVFNKNDIEIFKYYKQFGTDKSVLKFWTSQKEQNENTVLNSSQTVLKNEEDLKEIIKQKEAIIKIKDEQTQKYALLKQEEKKEKDEWIKKYDSLNNEKGEWMNKFYNIKMYAVVFWILFILASIFIVFLLKNSF